jgi:hypothetical protein
VVNLSASVDGHNGSTEGVSPADSWPELANKDGQGSAHSWPRPCLQLAQRSSASMDVYNGSTEGVSPDNSLAGCLQS